MNIESGRQFAESLNVAEEVLPYLHELLADIWILGSSPNRIATMLESLHLPPDRARILDLGCGKGAVAITLAQKLGVKVDGYDHYKPFFDEAIRKAKEHGVGDLCRFEFADINGIIPKARDYDVVIFAAVGPIGGNLKQCVGQLRRTVHQGGYILIDDGYAIEDKQIDFQGYDYVATRAESRQQLTAHGDRLVQEVIVPKDEVIADNRRNNEAIAERAAELTRRFPEKAQVFANFVQKEKDECKVIETCTEEAIWLLQKFGPLFNQ